MDVHARTRLRADMAFQSPDRPPAVMAKGSESRHALRVYVLCDSIGRRRKRFRHDISQPRRHRTRTCDDADDDHSVLRRAFLRPLHPRHRTACALRRAVRFRSRKFHRRPSVGVLDCLCRYHSLDRDPLSRNHRKTTGDPPLSQLAVSFQMAAPMGPRSRPARSKHGDHRP